MPTGYSTKNHVKKVEKLYTKTYLYWGRSFFCAFFKFFYMKVFSLISKGVFAYLDILRGL